MKAKAKDIIAKILIAALIVFLIAIIAVPIMNNLFAYRFRSQLEKAENCTGTIDEQVIGTCGDTLGDGDYKYIGAMLIEVKDKNVTPDLIISHFKALELLGAKNPSSTIEYEMVKLDGATFTTSFSNKPLTFTQPPENDDYTNCYALVICDGGYSSPFD